MLLVSASDKHETISAEVETVAKDFMTHKSSLLSKIATILVGAIENSFREAHKVEWRKARDTNEPNPYVPVLVKNINSVHKIVSEILPDMIAIIFSEVFENFIEILDNFLSTHESVIYDD